MRQGEGQEGKCTKELLWVMHESLPGKLRDQGIKLKGTLAQLTSASALVDVGRAEYFGFVLVFLFNSH